MTAAASLSIARTRAVDRAPLAGALRNGAGDLRMLLRSLAAALRSVDGDDAIEHVAPAISAALRSAADAYELFDAFLGADTSDLTSDGRQAVELAAALTRVSAAESALIAELRRARLFWLFGALSG